MIQPSRLEKLLAGSPEPGNIFHIAELSYKRLQGFDRDHTVVLFSVSPLEEHGSHLPVGTDLFEAEFFSAELARRLAERKANWNVLLGPPLPIGASAFDGPGTLLVRAGTVRRAARDYGAALARHGFKYILVMNAHAGPRHVLALERAAAAVSRRYGVRMFSLSGPVLWKLLRGKYLHRLEALIGRPLTPDESEAVRGDAHGGLLETSLLLRCRPELVGAEYPNLPPQRFSLLDALVPNYPLRLGNRQGYIGSPAAASASWGETARRLLLDAAWDLVEPVLDAQNRSWRRNALLFKTTIAGATLPRIAAGVGVLAVGTLGLCAFGTGALVYRLARRKKS
ncbi:MAG: creatininase family protein [Terriglobia bacterium]